MKSLTAFAGGAALALALATPAHAQASGSMPEFTNATWFNTPALTLGDLEGRAVMVEVFRTW